MKLMETELRDRFGNYKLLTGLEGSGKCWWCGGRFPDKRYRRYCSKICSDNYWNHFWWPWAVAEALKRANNKCQDCGAGGRGIYLEVHHLEPLNNEVRYMNIKNRPENLIVLCRSCHGKWHTKPKKTKTELAIEKGQAVMDLT
jgi:hypothetical protein